MDVNSSLFSLCESSAPLTRRSSRHHQEPIRFQAEQETESYLNAEQSALDAALVLSLFDAEEELNDVIIHSPEPVVDDFDEQLDMIHSQQREEKSNSLPSPLNWHIPPVLQAPALMSRRVLVGTPLHLPFHEMEPTPLSFLQLFLTPTLLTQWSQLTNQTIHHISSNHPPTDPRELLAYIGIHIFMGIDCLPAQRMYWSHEFHHPAVADVMSRERYELLNKCFTVSPPDPAASPLNPFSKVRSFMAYLNDIFPHFWHPSRHLALDESMVSFKGHSDIKQFVPGKPDPHGFKIWVLANSNYVLHFQLYQGKSVDGPSIHDMIIELTKPYHNSHRTLFIDSHFTSPTLLISLHHLGMRVCGSVRRNRIGMPSTTTLSPATLDAIAVGENIQLQRDHDSTMTLCAWRDKKLILLLYNHIDPNLHTTLQRWNVVNVLHDLPCPQAVHDYFHFARAVDIVNQIHKTYSPCKKSKQCSTRLVWWFIDICILNSFRLFQTSHVDFSQLQYRIQLYKELMAQLPIERRPQSHAHVCNKGIQLASDHYPVLSYTERDCVRCSTQPSQRTRTSYICHACQVPVCIACFGLYHTA
jgi:hypothetical protein